MRRRAALLAALGVLSFASASGGTENPVLVELFTSQGCSSCPRADELLSGWGWEAFARGEIVPLAFHVDYWDHIGWRDAFSSAEATRRQRLYAAALGERTVYTPQMVVAGRTGFVGSNAARARAETARHAGEAPAAEIGLSARFEGETLRVKVALRPSAPATGAKGVRVMLAVFENGLVTEVPRGENAGRTLRSDFVVRRLEDLGGFDPLAGRAFESERLLRPEEGWSRENLGVAVFLQEAAGMRTSGAKALYPVR